MIETILKMVTPSIVKNYLKDIHYRLTNLETAMHVLIATPTYIENDKVGFNGQTVRKEIFTELASKFKFQYIFETGTWIGDTTGFMANTANIPVFSTESNPLLHALAKMRLKNFTNIKLELLDSRQFFKKYANNSEITKSSIFIYLDAHSHDNLPLYEEVELIAQNWDKFVIMVDDFKVPFDKGYGYANYGKGKILSIEYLHGLFKQYNLLPFFPSKPSSEESGPKTGCVVLAKSGEFGNKLKEANSLKLYKCF